MVSDSSGIFNIHTWWRIVSETIENKNRKIKAQIIMRAYGWRCRRAGIETYMQVARKIIRQPRITRRCANILYNGHRALRYAQSHRSRCVRRKQWHRIRMKLCHRMPPFESMANGLGAFLHVFHFHFVHQLVDCRSSKSGRQCILCVCAGTQAESISRKYSTNNV